MSGFVKWLAFLTILFFGVGEFAGGWYLGVPPQTPIVVYKKTTSKQFSRRTTLSQAFPFQLDGTLESGTLTVEGIYERPTSFQSPSTKPLAAKQYFSETFQAGSAVHLSETMKRGAGIYTVRLIFENATGKFNLGLPTNSEL